MMMTLRIALATALVVALAACGEDNTPTTAPDDTPNNAPNNDPNNMVDESALTFFKDIKPLLDDKCNQCHVEGGAAPFPLETYEQVVMLKEAVRASIESGTMPPWQPDQSCNSFEGDFSMAQAQTDAILQWLDEGLLEGDPATEPEAVEPPKLSLDKVDLKLDLPEPYMPRRSPDDYRCFVMDWDETEDKYITGFQATPGNKAIVHHALAFTIEPNQVELVERLDAEEEGPGYTCYGTPFGGELGFQNFPRLLGTWVPGTAAIVFPEKTGIKIEPGSKIVIQMHYNTLGGDPNPDQSSFEFSVEDEVEDEAVFIPFTNPNWLSEDGMLIPAGEKAVTHDIEFSIANFLEMLTGGTIANGPFLIHSAFLHMHTLGAQTDLQVIRGEGDECMLDIPRWDFNWQATYTFEAPTRVGLNDAIRLSCTWDNSAENQPFAEVDTDGDGVPDSFVQQETRDVRWGDGTRDEMCISFMYITSDR